jgi:hypothetical protein
MMLSGMCGVCLVGEDFWRGFNRSILLEHKGTFFSFWDGRWNPRTVSFGICRRCLGLEDWKGSEYETRWIPLYQFLTLTTK